MKQLIIENIKLTIGVCRKVNSQFSILNSQLIALIAMMAITTSCRREPLYDEENNLRMEIEIDYNIKHTPDYPEPEMMFVGFYDQTTGRLLHSEYTGPRGGEVYVEAGTYDILTYNFDTEATQVRQADNINAAEAYATKVAPQVTQSYKAIIQKIKDKQNAPSRVQEYESQPIINEPDHLFTGYDQNTLVPVRGNDGSIFVIHADASTLLDTYNLTIGPIYGTENIATIEVFITGQAQSKILTTRQITGEPAVLHKPVGYGWHTRSSYLNTTFNTFGKYPDVDSKVILVVKITDYDGNITLLETDVTDQFTDPENTDANIVIEQKLVIEPPVNNGLAPSVTLWEEETTHITL